MPAIDTILGRASNPGATQTTVTMATGDSSTIRSFSPSDTAWIERIVRAGAATGNVRVLSPLLHDNVRGITFSTSESPAVMLMPPEKGQRVYPQDALTISVTGGTNETDLASLSIYYTNLPGATARLYMPSDVLPLMDYVKPMVVAVTNSGTAGQWTDTVITTTENQLKANTDYAVLGYIVDTAVALVGVKGSETGNLRVCGPGTTSTDDTSDFFITWSLREGTPHIPVFNSANNGAFFVSTADNTASSTTNVQLVLAHLTRNLS